MTCLRPDVADLYLEAELGPEERRECEAHLEGCPACRRMLEERRLFDQAAASLPAVEIPTDFASRVMARLPETGAPARRRAWLAPAAATAGFLLAGLLGAYLATGQGLTGVLRVVGRSFLDGLSLIVPLFAKVLKLVPVFARLVWEIGGALLRGLGALSSSFKPEVQGLALAGGFALIALTFFGLKALESIGRKP